MIGVKTLAHEDRPEKNHYAMEVDNDGGSWVFVADTRKVRRRLCGVLAWAVGDESIGGGCSR